MNMRCNRGKASLDTLVSRKTDESSSCNLQILWQYFYFRREVAEAKQLAASTYMKPGVVTAIRGSRKDVVEAIVGAILVQWMENGGLYRTSIGTFELDSTVVTGASSKHHRRHVSAYAWRFAGTSSTATHKLQARKR